MRVKMRFMNFNVIVSEHNYRSVGQLPRYVLISVQVVSQHGYFRGRER